MEDLERFTHKKKDYYIQESLYRQLEDFKDYEIGAEILKRKNTRTYSGDEVKKRLEELRNAKKDLVV